MPLYYILLISPQKNSTIENKTKEIFQPETICSLRKPKKIFSKRNKTIKEYFPRQIMCCFLLRDILEIKFEGLNLMCCCAKPNKCYQYICKIGSVKFDRGGAALHFFLCAKIFLTNCMFCVLILYMNGGNCCLKRTTNF